MSLKRVDPQDVCDLCCDAPTVHVNNQYIGQVFQWLVNNDYEICKKIPIRNHDMMDVRMKQQIK